MADDAELPADGAGGSPSSGEPPSEVLARKAGAETAVWRRAIGRRATAIAADGTQARTFEGMSLGELIADALRVGRRHALPLSQLLEAFIRLAGILARSHDRLVLHGGLRPECILIGRFGEVAITDWGAAALDPLKDAATGLLPPERRPEHRPRHEDDLYALCACLHHALFLRPACEAAPPDEAGAVPRELRAVLARGLAGERSARYASAQALLGDLRQAIPRDLVARVDGSLVGRPGLDSRVRWLLVGGMAAVLVALVVWRLLPRTPPPPPPPPPTAPPATIIADSFTTSMWKQHWAGRQGSGKVVTSRDSLTNVGHTEVLVLDRILTLPASMEFVGEIPASSRPGDMSIIWGEGSLADAGFAWPSSNRLPDNGRFFICQHAAFDNAFNGISRFAQRPEPKPKVDVFHDSHSTVGYESQPLAIGQAYRIRVEVDRHRIALYRDGRLVGEHREEIALRNGSFGLLLWYPGKRISSPRVQEAGQEQCDPLDTGDFLLMAGAYSSAADVFRALVRQSAEPRRRDAARLHLGMALAALGLKDECEATLAAIAEAECKGRADLLRLDILFESGDDPRTLAACEALWNAHPGLRPALGSRFGAMLERVVYDDARFYRYLDLRERVFPDDELSGNLAAWMLSWRGDYPRVIARFARHKHHLLGALMASARFDEALAIAPNKEDLRLVVAMQRGDFAAIPAEAESRLEALCLQNRLDEAAQAQPKHPLPMLYAGRLAAAAACVGPSELVDLAKAWQEGRPRPVLKLDPTAWEDLQRRAGGWRLGTSAEGVLRARIEGLPAAEQAAWRKRLLGAQFNWMDGTWFARFLLVPLLEAIDGNPQPLKDALADPGLQRADVCGGRLQPFVRRLRGEIDEATFLAQPAAVEAPAWLLLADACAAEAAGDPVRARELWRRLAALPRHARCFNRIQGSELLELLIAWRAGTP